jgi:hypothetical protein
METKIPVLLTPQQIEYIMSHAHDREISARQAERPATARFFLDLWETLFNARVDVVSEREVELNYERGAA